MHTQTYVCTSKMIFKIFTLKQMSLHEREPGGKKLVWIIMEAQGRESAGVWIIIDNYWIIMEFG